MEEFKISDKNKNAILALGAESAGNFSVFKNGIIYFSKDFGDLSRDANFKEYTKQLNDFLKKEKIKPEIILSDLHPIFRTTLLAQELAKKYKAQYLPVQHHLAHIFSAIGDEIVERGTWNVERDIIGIACDGTGFGFDEKIWGGEVFKLKAKKLMPRKLELARVGHLENQVMIGGEIAIKEPARILISILSKFLKKSEVQEQVKKYYSGNEFEVLWNQLEQNFNCLETSSTARILDAVSVLLGFSKNESLVKHGPVALLEQNSTKPYNLKPKLERYKKQDTNHKQISNSKSFAPSLSLGQIPKEMIVLNTTYLFEYLIKNLHKDKERLSATAQKYIADGLLKTSNQLLVTSNQKGKKTNQLRVTSYELPKVFFAGGMANNKIISSTLESQGVYTNKKIPRGDAGISFGQIIYFLLSK